MWCLHHQPSMQKMRWAKTTRHTRINIGFRHIITNTWMIYHARGIIMPSWLKQPAICPRILCFDKHVFPSINNCFSCSEAYISRNDPQLVYSVVLYNGYSISSHLDLVHISMHGYFMLVYPLSFPKSCCGKQKYVVRYLHQLSFQITVPSYYE